MKTINAMTKDGPVPVKATIFGPFAVHRRIEGTDFNITHVASGLTVCADFNYKREAIRAIGEVMKVLPKTSLFYGSDTAAICKDKQCIAVAKYLRRARHISMWSDLEDLVGSFYGDRSEAAKILESIRQAA